MIQAPWEGFGLVPHDASLPSLLEYILILILNDLGHDKDKFYRIDTALLSSF
jgi:hypothetical protein